MKIAHTHRGYWVAVVMVFAIIAAEYAASIITDHFGLTNSPIMVAVLTAGIVGVLADAFSGDSIHH
jgi:hypothetical protein